MNSTSRDMIEFCLQFIKVNVNEASQRAQCRVWIKTAIDTIKKEELGSKDFIITKLDSIDRYLSGADSKMTSVGALTEIDTISQLLI